MKEMDETVEKVKEKEAKIVDLEERHRALIVRECKSNGEMQEARLEIINVRAYYFFAYVIERSV